MTSASDSEEELAEAKENARRRFEVWRRRSLYSTVLLLLSCASVVPFSKGHSLHVYAEPLGRLLVYLSMGMLLVFLYCTGLFYGAWQCLRDLKSGRT